ncbi:MAG TPA: septal ring lytic transglycosylase RlpA family protein [Thermoanaerobaculia bacterium]|nr:septal ring lytic transglycosylase RlpA family protein [Thermoanaerobaculia bacterium]
MRRAKWPVVGFTKLALAASLFYLFLLTGCSNHPKPSVAPGVGLPLQRGLASWYGPKFQGRRTASGERYDMHDKTAAHLSLPFGTRLGVRNVRTGREVLVRVNDRGPFSKNRIIDLSYAAAKELGIVGEGTASVELYAISEAGAPMRYTVQVGAFSEPERALALHHEIARYYPEAVVDSDGTWSRVQIGAFDDRDHAESLRRELAAIGMQAVVVSAR